VATKFIQNKGNTMKTLRLKNNTIARMADDHAFKMVQQGDAQYIPKNVWKREVRDREE
jgi:hypothetical protein